jgi:decaprenylphospho-beta-D-ribofuranose 2-oxidase
MGRSYGDAAQNAGGTVVQLDLLALSDGRPSIDLDAASGVARCAAGVSLHDLIQRVLPSGWFPAVTPGTRWVTLGGAVAADVHGKNHHRDGSFGGYLRSLRLVTPAHGVLHLTPEEAPELFWATVGGMGLTGVVSEVEVALRRVGSVLVDVDTSRCDSVDEVIRAVLEGERERRYTVAWIDLLSRTGRGIVTAGEHVEDPAGGGRPTAPQPRASIPFVPPKRLLTRSTVTAFNEMWFRRVRPGRRLSRASLWGFFYPLDGVAEWNRVYGPGGLVQYQVVVPTERTLRSIVERLQARRVPVALAVLKTFGAANAAPLSFPMPGWTLAIDVPRNTPGLAGLLDELDELTTLDGGRTYFAKDSRVRPELVPTMYPRLDEWREVRARVDPDHVLSSDLSRRLRL